MAPPPKLKTFPAQFNTPLLNAIAKFKELNGHPPGQGDVDAVINVDRTCKLATVHKSVLKGMLKRPPLADISEPSNTPAAKSKPLLLSGDGTPLGAGKFGVPEAMYLLTGKHGAAQKDIFGFPISENGDEAEVTDVTNSYESLYRVIPCPSFYAIQVTAIAGYTPKFEITEEGNGISVKMSPKNTSPYLHTKQLSASAFKKDVQSQAILRSFQAAPLPDIDFVIPLDQKVCNMKYTVTRFVYEKVDDGEWKEVTNEREGGESEVWKKKDNATYFPMVVGYVVSVDIVQNMVLVVDNDVNDL
ncbi:hypothetical protein HDU79_011100 [Rhizoclosmatium sp. JEL0117]|nr:hypothetical protein HDU79_011100 [Rhizoclosmatium sp. JEL0117]